MHSTAVLITGCSSGIGRATAQHLAGRGHTVYATARREESIADLAALGCRTLALDVTDEASMTAAVDRVVAEEGAVGALVNNAGYSLSGAIETVDMDDVRRQFETNPRAAQAPREVYEKGPLARLGGGPEVVAQAIEQALTAPRPKIRYRMTPSARLLIGQRRLMTDGLWDRMLTTQFPRPG